MSKLFIKEFAKIGKSIMERISGEVETFVDDCEPVPLIFPKNPESQHAIDESALQKEMEQIKKKCDEYYLNQYMENKKDIHTLMNKYYQTIKNIHRKFQNGIIQTEKELEERLNEALLNYQEKYAEIKAFENANQNKTGFIIKKTRLPKYAQLLYLLYHFLPIENKVIRKISEKALAEELNCTVQTIRNSNRLLMSVGLIILSNCGKGYINVMLPYYEEYHQEGGSGYIKSIPYTWFKELIHLNVNTIRVEIRKQVKYDNDAIKRKYNKNASLSKISRHDLKLFLPKYTHYSRKLKEITEQNGTKAFSNVFQMDGTYFALNQEYDGNLLREKRYHQYSEKIINLTQYGEPNSVFNSLREKDFESLIQLCFEYSLQEVLQALSIAKARIENDDTLFVHNIGAYIRTQIRIMRTEEILDQKPLLQKIA